MFLHPLTHVVETTAVASKASLLRITELEGQLADAISASDSRRCRIKELELALEEATLNLEDGRRRSHSLHGAEIAQYALSAKVAQAEARSLEAQLVEAQQAAEHFERLYRDAHGSVASTQRGQEAEMRRYDFLRIPELTKQVRAGQEAEERVASLESELEEARGFGRSLEKRLSQAEEASKQAAGAHEHHFPSGESTIQRSVQGDARVQAAAAAWNVQVHVEEPFSAYGGRPCASSEREQPMEELATDQMTAQSLTTVTETLRFTACSAQAFPVQQQQLREAQQLKVAEARQERNVALEQLSEAQAVIRDHEAKNQEMSAAAQQQRSSFDRAQELHQERLTVVQSELHLEQKSLRTAETQLQRLTKRLKAAERISAEEAQSASRCLVLQSELGELQRALKAGEDSVLELQKQQQETNRERETNESLRGLLDVARKNESLRSSKSCQHLQAVQETEARLMAQLAEREEMLAQMDVKYSELEARLSSSEEEGAARIHALEAELRTARSEVADSVEATQSYHHSGFEALHAGDTFVPLEGLGSALGRSPARPRFGQPSPRGFLQCRAASDAT